MANYEGPILQGSLTTTYKTAALLLVGSTARRAMVYEIEMGQTGGLSSTDCQVQWDVSRNSTTNLFTATAVTANLLDLGDSAASYTFQNNATNEGTYTTAGAGLAIKSWGVNQRGTNRWRALDDGDNIIIPASAGAGLGVRALSSNFTGSAIGNVSWVER
jgi:hypothetical protein